MRRIFAIGGMGDRVTVENMFASFLKLVGKPSPVIGYLGTASGDRVGGVEMFVWQITRQGGVPRVIPLFQRTPNLEEILRELDGVYVGGGNTFSMLALWKAWNLDRLLRKRYEEGMVLAGVSAGAICWFEQALTDSWADRLRVIPALGWLRGCGIPHYRIEPDRKPTTHQMLRSGEIQRGIAIDDGAAVMFENEQPVGVVATHPNAQAYRVQIRNEKIIEEPLPKITI